MGVEQLELSIANSELFSKNFKLLNIETTSTDKPFMYLRGGFFDASKR